MEPPLAAGAGHILPYGYQNLIYTQVALDAQGDIFLGGLDPSSGYSRCAVAELANGTGSQQWRQNSARPNPASRAMWLSTRRQCGDDRQHVSAVLSEHKPFGNERCISGEAEFDWSGVWLQQFGTGKDIPRGTSSPPRWCLSLPTTRITHMWREPRREHSQALPIRIMRICYL